MRIFTKFTPCRHLAAAVLAALLPLLAASGCLRLEPSPLQQIGPLGVTLLPVAADCGKTFHAYSGSSTTFYSYDRCNGLQTHTLSGPQGLVSVAKTTAGFVGIDGSVSSNQVFFSADGISWTVAGTFATGGPSAALARVAACGNTVVVAYPTSAGMAAALYNLPTLISGNGGVSFAAGAPVVGDNSNNSLRDLVCSGGRFFASTGHASPQKWTDDPGTAWTNATGVPGSGRGIGVYGNTLVSFYLNTLPTLMRSSDRGGTWTGASPTLAAYPASITHTGAAFIAPHVGSGTACVMARSTDSNGTAWDESVTAPCPGTGNKALYRVASDGPTVVAVGSADIGTLVSIVVGMVLVSQDGGATWTAVHTGGAPLNDVIAF